MDLILTISGSCFLVGGITLVGLVLGDFYYKIKTKEFIKDLYLGEFAVISYTAILCGVLLQLIHYLWLIYLI